MTEYLEFWHYLGEVRDYEALGPEKVWSFSVSILVAITGCTSVGCSYVLIICMFIYIERERDLATVYRVPFEDW